MKDKIGIIGSGVVAKALGAGFIKYGHEVMLGSRSPEKLSEWLEKDGEGAKTGSFADAASFGQLLILAIPGRYSLSVLKDIGEASLKNKTIIDATNPIADSPPEDGALKFFTTMNQSLMEKLQGEFPAAHFIKAFNSIGSAFMVDPDFDEKPTMFICGDDSISKQEVKEICEKFGWDTADMGGATGARAIEPLCMLWCIPGFRENSWSHAFRLLRK